jgi:hypothetical protein
MLKFLFFILAPPVVQVSLLICSVVAYRSEVCRNQNVSFSCGPPAMIAGDAEMLFWRFFWIVDDDNENM